MIKFLKKNWIYFLIFIFTFIFYCFFFSFGSRGDSLNNFGFSHAIRMGEIPYKDFNTVSTPLYAFVMSIGLFIWDNHLVFLFEQSIFFTIMIYMISKIIDKKWPLVILAFLSFSCLALNTTYNFFALFLLITLLYLEKFHSKKDLLTGFVVGLIIMTKHTIGVFFIIPSIIFYWKDLKRLFKRFLGLLIPCFYFLIYFLFHKSLYKLLDLCLFGLFDFGGNNNFFSKPLFVTTIIFVCIFIFFIIKDRKNVLNYYLLCSTFFVIPICDVHHFAFFYICFIIFILQYIKLKPLFIFYVMFSLLWVFAYTKLYFMSDFTNNSKFKHLEYSVFDKNFVKKINKTYDMFDSYGDNVIVFSYDTMLYEIVKDKKIDYYGVFLDGNFGYNGNNKMIKQIKKQHDTYVFIEKKSYDAVFLDDSQFSNEICDYVMKNYEFIEEKNGYKIYYIK